MSAKASGETVRGEVVRDVESASECKEAMRNAESLGLRLDETQSFGSWQSANGHPVFPGYNVEIEKVGRKYIHMVLDGETIPVESVDAAGGQGKLRLTFKA